jgi:hypothetical protein
LIERALPADEELTAPLLAASSCRSLRSVSHAVVDRWIEA